MNTQLLHFVNDNKDKITVLIERDGWSPYCMILIGHLAKTFNEFFGSRNVVSNPKPESVYYFGFGNAIINYNFNYGIFIIEYDDDTNERIYTLRYEGRSYNLLQTLNS